MGGGDGGGGGDLGGGDHYNSYSPGGASKLHLLANAHAGRRRKSTQEGLGLPSGSVAAFESFVSHGLDIADYYLGAGGGGGGTGAAGGGGGGGIRTISRKSLLLKLPSLVEGLSAVDIPGMAEDRNGFPCVVVLPSDR